MKGSMENYISQEQNNSNQYPFNSSYKRVIYPASNHNPGPGSYDLPPPNIHSTSKYHIPKANSHPHNHQWILDQGRAFVSNSNQYIGPGSYNIPNQLSSIQIRSEQKRSWAKSNRFHSQIDESQIGPGSYNYQLQDYSKQAAEAAFNSKSPKSFMNQIVLTEPAFQSPHQRKFINNLNKSELPVKTPPEDKKRLSENSPIFASKVPRFSDESKPFHLGPGCYNLNQNAKIKVWKNMIKVKTYHSIHDSNQSERVAIGPGSYNTKNYELSHSIQKKGYPISRETRFNYRSKNKSTFTIPGPGHYNQNKYMYANEQELNQRTGKGKSTSMRQIQKLKSSCNLSKVVPCPSKHLPHPTCYDVKVYDIDYRAQKKVEHNEKLKLMEVDVPAFNSRAPRVMTYD